jgi:hypothetical protein
VGIHGLHFSLVNDSRNKHPSQWTSAQVIIYRIPGFFNRMRPCKSSWLTHTYSSDLVPEKRIEEIGFVPESPCFRSRPSPQSLTNFRSLDLPLELQDHVHHYVLLQACILFPNDICASTSTIFETVRRHCATYEERWMLASKQFLPEAVDRFYIHAVYNEYSVQKTRPSTRTVSRFQGMRFDGCKGRCGNSRLSVNTWKLLGTR